MTSPVGSRPTSLLSELDELSAVLAKSELASVAGVNPSQLTPSRVAGLGREPVERLDDLWVVLVLARGFEAVDDVAFFLRTRQPALDYATPLSLVASGLGQRVIDWLRPTSTTPIAPDTAASRGATERQLGGLQPLGRSQRPPTATGTLQPGGRPTPDAPGDRADRLARAVRRATTQEGLEPDVLEELGEFAR